MAKRKEDEGALQRMVEVREGDLQLALLLCQCCAVQQRHSTANKQGFV
jgi:hypothetical protein